MAVRPPRALAHIFGRVPAAPLPIKLARNRIYILPTRHGWGFAFMLLALLLGSINYNNSLGYLVTFGLASVLLVSILHTYANLVGLEVLSGLAMPVFAGEGAVFEIRLDSGGRPRPGLTLAFKGGAGAGTDAEAGAETCVRLQVPAPSRGRMTPGVLRIETRYPFGLFRAWSLPHPDVSCIVYPAPAESSRAVQARRPAQADTGSPGAGPDDFFGLRPYQPGDPLPRIAWKASGRGRGLVTKEFRGTATPDVIWIDWDLLHGLDTENRLRVMSRALLDAERAGVSYGLRLPGTTVHPSRGDRHRHACLSELALFGTGTGSGIP